MRRPDVFVPLTTPHPDRKANYVFEGFETQRRTPWFDGKLFVGLMCIRDMESNSSSDQAEAFNFRKLVVQ